MGKAISKLYSLALREVKTYNIEKRAERVISKEKPDSAPMYQSTIEHLKYLDEEKISKEYLRQKDEKLDGYLKNVYVTSSDPPPQVKRIINPERPLPQKTYYDYNVSFGYSEIEEKAVPPGRVSLKQALQFINDHKSDPETYSNTAIATQYKLPITSTDDILEHFKVFNVNVQKKEINPEELSAFQRLQLRVKDMNISNAPDILREMKKLREKESSEISEVEIKDYNKSDDIKVSADSGSSSNKKDKEENR